MSKTLVFAAKFCQRLPWTTTAKGWSNDGEFPDTDGAMNFDFMVEKDEISTFRSQMCSDFDIGEDIAEERELEVAKGFNSSWRKAYQEQSTKSCKVGFYSSWRKAYQLKSTKVEKKGFYSSWRKAWKIPEKTDVQ